MAGISTKSLQQFLLSWISAAQASASQVLDFSVGSVNLAIAEAGSAVALWLQRLALLVLQQARFATSQGGDADSWGAQFEFNRLGATFATVIETVFASSPATVSNIPVGTQMQTADGTQTFQVYADTTNPNWDSTILPSGGYDLNIGVASISIPLINTVAGSAGNVLADTVTVLLGSLSGIASATNPAAAQGGLDAESDAAYKARFPAYLAGLARANYSAIEAAVLGVQQGLQYLIVENQMVVGSSYPFYDRFTYFSSPGSLSYPTLIPWPGRFFVIINDGSGSPPTSLITQVSLAVNAVRGLAIEYNVLAPIILVVSVSLTLTALAGYTLSTVEGQAAVALQNWINSLPLGTTLIPLARIPQVVYDAVAGVSNVTQVTINGVASDLTLNYAQVARAGVVTVE